MASQPFSQGSASQGHNTPYSSPPFLPPLLSLSDLPTPPEISAYPLLKAFYRVSVEPNLPIAFCIGYVFLVRAWNWSIRSGALEKKPQFVGSAGKRAATSSSTSGKEGRASPGVQQGTGSLFSKLVIAHNVYLCLFSLAVFCSFLPSTIRNFTTRGLNTCALCDHDQVWSLQNGLLFHTWIFYLSKYSTR